VLRQILHRLTTGGTWTVARLANELDATPQLVEAALDELTRCGYLRPAGAACTASCAFCPLTSWCVQGTGERVWALEQRGPG